MTRILIVDDSPTACMALKMALSKDPDIEVIGTTDSGSQALHLVGTKRPDLVTMDVHLRGENGIEVTAAIMANRPVPILIITDHNPTDAKLIYHALEAGALEVYGKLPAPMDPAYEPRRHRLLRLVKSLSRVPVVHRKAALRPPTRRRPDSRAEPREPRSQPTTRIAVLGASTGGPPLIARILRDLPVRRQLPIVLVQHITAGFGAGFVRWLESTTGHRVLLVDRELELDGSTVYVAQPNTHVVFHSRTEVAPSDQVPRGFQKPSINTLFDSAARVFGGAAIGILLTGMGQDGASGLDALHRSGGTTVAQNPDTCVVPSMPMSAIERGVVDLVLPPDQIGSWLARLP